MVAYLCRLEPPSTLMHLHAAHTEFRRRQVALHLNHDATSSVSQATAVLPSTFPYFFALDHFPPTA